MLNNTGIALMAGFLLDLAIGDPRWLYHPVNTMLTHGWLKNFKPHGIANDTLQYLSIETPEGRDASRRKWNAPRWLPAWLALAALSAAALMPALRNQRGGGAGRG